MRLAPLEAPRDDDAAAPGAGYEIGGYVAVVGVGGSEMLIVTRCPKYVGLRAIGETLAAGVILEQGREQTGCERVNEILEDVSVGSDHHYDLILPRGYVVIEA